VLRQEAGKSHKQKRTTKQLHADLTALGYDTEIDRLLLPRSVRAAAQFNSVAVWACPTNAVSPAAVTAEAAI
jgi:hypothetical protein